MASRITRRGREPGLREPQQIEQAELEERSWIGKRGEERLGQPDSHGGLPAGEAAPRIAVRTERGGGTIDVTRDGGARSIGSWMGAFVDAGPPLKSDVAQRQRAKRG